MGRSIVTLIVLVSLYCLRLSSSAYASCSSPAIQSRGELLAGQSSNQWDIDDAGDLSIQGFATDISFNVGNQVNFKINTNASAYTINIYRMGYYSGMGARKVASILPSAQLPQSQPVANRYHRGPRGLGIRRLRQLVSLCVMADSGNGSFRNLLCPADPS